MRTPTNKIRVSIDGTELETIKALHARLTADGATVLFTDYHVPVIDGRETATVEFTEIHPQEVDEHDAGLSEEFYSDPDRSDERLEGATVEARLVYSID